MLCSFASTKPSSSWVKSKLSEILFFPQADKKPEHEPNENYCLGVCLHDSAGNHGNSHSSHSKNSCSAKDNGQDQLSPDFHAWSSAFCTSTGTALTDFIQTEKLMSSQVISFGLPLYIFVMLLPVFIFLAEGARLQITFPWLYVNKYMW